MNRYFFAATALPPLQMGNAPEMNFREVMFLLQTNLSREDWEKILVLRRYYDVENVRSFLRDQAFDERASCSLPQFEEALSGLEILPDYFTDFLAQYDTTEKRISHFPFLLASYYTVERNAATGLLRKYLSFERGWRLTVTALRAKQLGRDLTRELRYEDPNDPLVAQLLVQKDNAQIEPPDGYEALKAIFQSHQYDPLGLYKAIYQWRFDVIEEMYGVDLFSIDRIVGYVAQLITVEKWFELDQQEGIKQINSVLKGIS